MPPIRSDVPLPALLKRFALIYLPIVMVLSIVLLSSIRLDKQRLVERIAGHENSRIEAARERVTKDFEAAADDLRIIANLSWLREYLDRGDPAQREALETYFLLLSQETQHYDQVCYLDASGQEVIRINYHDGKPAIVPREQFQNKSGRYFFSDTIKLNRGEVFISPLDLNIENDRLEIPHKPIIRFGTPVFDSAGRKKGIILLNYFGDELLQHFREGMPGDDSHSAMLLNRDGYWLSSTQREDEWGFMLGKSERTFGHDFPAAWSAISAAERGFLLTDQGLFVYTTAYPLLQGQHSSTGSALANAPSQEELSAHEYHWKIVSFIPHDVLSGAAFYNQPSGRIALSVVYLLLALAAFIVALVTLKRKLAEEELRIAAIAQQEAQQRALHSEARYKALIQQAASALFVHDSDGRFVEVNHQACDSLGYTHEELLQMNVADISPGFDLARGRALWSQLEPGKPMSITATHRRKDGSTFPVEVHFAALEIEGKKLVMTLVSDITERKQVEEKLQLFRHLIEHSRDGVAIVDPATGRFLDMNEAICRYLGYTYDELLQRSVVDIQTNIRDIAIWQAHQQKLRAQGYALLEFDALHKDGSRSIAEVSLRYVTIGNQDYNIAVVRDITERKQAEQALQVSLAEKGVLMREIHHRVKNNLQMMSALLELQSGYVKDEQVLGFFKDSQQRIQSMAMIHEQLYRNENVAQIDFAIYLRSLVDNLCGQFSERCSLVSIQINAQACTLPVDVAIPCGLAVNELVSNVFKHAFPEGRAGELRIALQCSDDGKVVLEVADDGVGLPVGLDIHRSKSFGLRVIKLMVEEQMHGKLTVESNHGTRVVCEIGVP